VVCRAIDVTDILTEVRGTGYSVTPLTIHSLGRLALDRRGDRGIRAVAEEIGISPATLSRVERGKLPDLDTFGKMCKCK